MVHGDGSDLVAKAENEALVLIYVPPQYKGNWKHFLGVVSHLYIESVAGIPGEKIAGAGGNGPEARRAAGGHFALLGGDGSNRRCRCLSR